MIKRLGIKGLSPGVYICGFEKAPGAKPVFFMNNILIKDAEDVERFSSYGYSAAYVVAEDEEPRVGGESCPAKTPFAADSESLPCGPAAGVEKSGGGLPARVEDVSAGKDPGAPDPVEFPEEIKEAKKIRDDAETLVRGFMKEARMGGAISAENVHATVEKMIDSIFRNKDAIVSLSMLKSFDDYTFAHSVNVSILSLAVGRHTGLERTSLFPLGVGAILHDVGKTRVPEAILKKPGRLTEDEFAVMKRHPLLGAEILSSTKGIKNESVRAALEHHERYNGDGYPGGLKGGLTHPYARITAVADIYDAMTSARVYQRPLMPDEALKKMYQMREHFEPGLVERLIKCLGIYPIGTLVLLNTGEAALVRLLNRGNPLQPAVLMFFNEERKRLDPPFEVDLRRDGKRWIAGSAHPEEFGLAPEDIAASIQPS